MTECIIEPFKVLVRIRPSNQKEETVSLVKKSNKNMISIKENQLMINDNDVLYDILGKKEKLYTFDNIFQEKDKNHTIFNQSILNMIDNIHLGYNSTALAYGVTGAGKTHTMFGDIYNTNTQEKGIATYATEYLFEKLKTNLDVDYNVKISYLEIYNEQVIDLLHNNINPLLVIEDPIKGIYVPDLSEYKVKNSNELIKYIIQGNTKRTMAPTGQNQFSSRSHAILQIAVEQRKPNNNDAMLSKFMIVDLAGSERGNMEKGIRLHEGSNINKSLLALGNCINLLSDKSKKTVFVPYRDSKLTRLLKESLGGNIITVMIACISPSSSSYEDIVNTLNYASRARKIQNKINKNFKEDDERNYKDVIHSLKVEITQLKEVIFKQTLNSKEIKKINNNTFQIQSICNVTENIRKDNKSYKFDKEKKIVENFMYQENTINFKKEVYESLISNFMPSNNKLEELEKRVESYFSEKIQNGNQIIHKDYECSKQISEIKDFFEKHFDIINVKMTEIIKQDLIFNYNLKELNELKESNEMQIQKLSTDKEKLDKNLNSGFTEDSEKQYWKVNEELRNIKKINNSNEKEREKLVESIEKNQNEKNKLRDILWKLSKNSHKKEISHLSQVIEKLEKENAELQKQNFNNQNLNNQISKENENLKQEINNLKKEKEKLKKSNSQLKVRLETRDKQTGSSYDAQNGVSRRNDNNFKRAMFKSSENNPMSRNKAENLNKQSFPLKSGKVVYFLGKEGFKNEDSKEDIEKKSHKSSLLHNSLNQENDKHIEIDIQMITPLKNFKIDFEKCQFLKMEDSPDRRISKNSPLKRIEGFKEKKSNDIGGNVTRVSLNKSQKSKIDNDYKYDRKLLKKNEYFNTVSCLEKSNCNNIQVNLNKSLSLSKVNYKNEISYEPENENDFINTRIFDDFKINSPIKKRTDKKLPQIEDTIIKCSFPKNKFSDKGPVVVIRDNINNSADKTMIKPKPKAVSDKTLKMTYHDEILKKNYFLKDTKEKSPNILLSRDILTKMKEAF